MLLLSAQFYKSRCQSISWHFHIDGYQRANKKEMPFLFMHASSTFLHEIKQEQGYRAAKRTGHVETILCQ